MVIWRSMLLVLAALVSGIVLVCFLASTEGVGKPFMGFLLGRNRIVAPIGLTHWTGFRAGIPFGSQLTEVDGRPVDNVSSLVETIWDTPIGRPATSRRLVHRSGRPCASTRVLPTRR